MNRFDTLDPCFEWRAERPSWPLECRVGPGLAGAVAATTTIAWVDPARNRLHYRGLPIEAVARRYGFAAVAFLLIDGRQPEAAPAAFAAFERRLGDARSLPHNVVALVQGLPRDTHPTRLLRAGTSALGCFELSADDELSGTVHWEDLRIVGQTAELVRVVAAHVEGRPPTPCDFTAPLAAGVLAALSGRPPAAEHVRLLELCWTLYADHGLDAPTFTGMVVGSCLSDPYTNIVAALSALRGPRLGGAGQQVLEQLLGLRSPAAARSWVAERLLAGHRIAGFGHRLYAGEDPRVAILRQEAARLAAGGDQQRLLAVARAVEAEAGRRLAAKGVAVNANFYAAILFHLLGARPALVPCLYAVGRVAGIVARVREYVQHNRLFRPRSRYVGPARRAYRPLEAR